VIDTDKFAMMSLSARYLYFELSVRADDDGFLGAPMRIVRMVGCEESDLEELERSEYVIKFKTGVIVIRDWNVHNTIRKDMYNETIYQKERDMLCVINGRYYLKTDNVTDSVTDNVTDNVTDSVTDNVTDSVTDNVTDSVTGSVTDSVTDNVTDSVTGSVTLSKDNISKDNISKDSALCSEPEAPPSEPPLISLPLNDKSFHDVFCEDVDNWKELYPAVDIVQELRKMKGWLNSNPTKRKTRRGINRFINSWLAREQDKRHDVKEISAMESSERIIPKSKEEIEKEIYKIVHAYLSQEALERYYEKSHELIELCCPLEDFTQEQIDYMRSNWGIELRPGVDRFIPPTEENYHWWDARLSD
jgi:hypothetical protein